MVRVRVECHPNSINMEHLYEALKNDAKVTNVCMVVDSTGRSEAGYFVEFEGVPYVAPTP